MTTALESKSARQIPLLHSVKRWSGDGTWARACAWGGAGVWAALAIMARVGMARIGAIELIFLFAPLVIVPLGIELGRAMSIATREEWDGLDVVMRLAQPFGAACAVTAFLLPPGRVAGLMACGWLVVCCLAGGSGGISAVTGWRGGGRGAGAPM